MDAAWVISGKRKVMQHAESDPFRVFFLAVFLKICFTLFCGIDFFFKKTSG